MDLPKNDKSLNEQDELRRLREENARLKELLTHHGIIWEESAAIPWMSPSPARKKTANHGSDHRLCQQGLAAPCRNR